MEGIIDITLDDLKILIESFSVWIFNQVILLSLIHVINIIFYIFFVFFLLFLLFVWLLLLTVIVVQIFNIIIKVNDAEPEYKDDIVQSYLSKWVYFLTNVSSEYLIIFLRFVLNENIFQLLFKIWLERA